MSQIAFKADLDKILDALSKVHKKVDQLTKVFEKVEQVRISVQLDSVSLRRSRRGISDLVGILEELDKVTPDKLEDSLEKVNIIVLRLQKSFSKLATTTRGLQGFASSVKGIGELIAIVGKISGTEKGLGREIGGVLNAISTISVKLARNLATVPAKSIKGAELFYRIVQSVTKIAELNIQKLNVDRINIVAAAMIHFIKIVGSLEIPEKVIANLNKFEIIHRFVLSLSRIFKIINNEYIKYTEAVGLINSLFAGMYRFIRNLAQNLTGLNPERFESNVLGLIESIGTVIKSLGKFVKGVIAADAKSIRAATKFISTLIDAISKFITSFLALINNVQLERASTSGNRFKRTFFGFLRGIGGLFGRKSKSIILKTFEPVIEVFKVFIDLLTKVPANALNAASKFITVVQELMKDLAVIVYSVDRVELGGFLRRFSRMRKISRVMGLFRKIIESTLNSLSKYDPRLAQPASTILKTIYELFKNFQLFENIKISWKNLFVLFFKVRGFIVSVIRPMRGVIEKLVKSGDAGTLGAAATILKSYGEFFSTFVSLLKSRNFSKSDFRDFSKQFGVLLKPLKNIASAFGFFPKILGKLRKLKPEQISAVTPIFKNIAEMIRSIIDFQKSMLEISDKLKTKDNLEKLGKSGGFLSKLLSPITGLAKGLGKLTTRRNRRGIVNLGKMFKQIFKSFSYLKKLNVDSSVFASIDGLFKTLSKPDVINLLKSNINVDKSMFKSLSEGIKYFADVPERVGRVLESVATILNKIDIDKLEQFNKIIKESPRRLTTFGRVLTRLRGLTSFTQLILSATKGVKRFIASVGSLISRLTRLSARTLFNVGRSFLSNFSNPIAQINSRLSTTFNRLVNLGRSLFFLNQVRQAVEGFVRALKITDTINFDKTLTQLQVLAGFTEEEAQKSAQLAYRIGKEYQFSASEGIEAILDLAKAGLSQDAITRILPTAADLAALSDTNNLERSTQALIAATNTFTEFADGVEGTYENISVAADIISAAADVSTASVESLTDGLANVGPAAEQAGLTLEETAALLAIFDQNAIRGAESGTALRSLLNGLTRPAGQRALEQLQRRVRGLGGEFRDLNLSLYDSEGNRRNFADFINDLDKALSGLSQQERDSYLARIVDTYGRQGLNILLREGADGILEITDAMNQVAPATDRAREMLDNMAGDLLQLKGSFETFMIRVGIPIVETFLRPFVKLGRLVVDTLLSMNDFVLEIISNAIGLTTALGGVLAALGAFLVIIPKLGALLGLLGKVSFLGLLKLPFLLGSVLTLAAPVTLVFGTLTTAVLGFSAAFTTVKRVIQNNVGGAGDALQGLVDFIRDDVFSVFGDLIHLFKSIGDIIGEIFQNTGGFTRFGEYIADNINAITKALKASPIGKLARFTKEAVEFGSVVAGQVKGILRLEKLKKRIDQASSFSEYDRYTTQYREQRQALIDSVTESIADLFKTNSLVYRAIRQSITKTNDVYGVAQEIVEKTFIFGEKLIDGIRSVGDAFRGLFDNLIQGNGIVDSFREFLKTVNKDFGDIVVLFIDYIEDIFIVDIPDGVRDAFNVSFTEGMSTAIKTLISKVKTILYNNREAFSKVLATALQFFLSPLKIFSLAGHILDLLGFSDLAGVFKSISSAINELFTKLSRFIINIVSGQSFGDAISDAFGDSLTPVIEFLSSLSKTVVSIANFIGNAIDNILFAIFGNGDETISGVTAFVNFLSNTAIDILDKLSVFFNGLSYIVNSLASGDTQPLIDFLNGVLDSISNTFTNIWNSILEATNNFDFGQIARLFITGIRNIIAGVASALGIDVRGIIEFFDNLVTNSITENGDMLSDLLVGAANSILQLLGIAISNALTSIGNILGIDFNLTHFLDALSIAIESNIALMNDESKNPFIKVGLAIINLIVGAVTAVIQGIGDILASLLPNTDFSGIQTEINNTLDTLLGTIETTLTGENSIINRLGNIATSIGTIVSTFFNNLASALGLSSAESGAESGQNFAESFFGALVNTGLQLVETGLGLINDVLEAINLVLGYIDDTLSNLSNADSSFLDSLGGLIAVIGTAFVGLAPFAGALTPFLGALGGLFGKIATIAKFGAALITLATFFENFENFFNSITKALDGDIVGGFQDLLGAIIDFILDLGQNTIEVLGLDYLFENVLGFNIEELRSRAEQAIRDIGGIIGTVLNALRVGINNIITDISIFFTVTLPNEIGKIQSSIDSIRSTLLGTGGGTEEQLVKLDNLTTLLSENPQFAIQALLSRNNLGNFEDVSGLQSIAATLVASDYAMTQGLGEREIINEIITDGQRQLRGSGAFITPTARYFIRSSIAANVRALSDGINNLLSTNPDLLTDEEKQAIAVLLGQVSTQTATVFGRDLAKQNPEFIGDFVTQLLDVVLNPNQQGLYEGADIPVSTISSFIASALEGTVSITGDYDPEATRTILSELINAYLGLGGEDVISGFSEEANQAFVGTIQEVLNRLAESTGGTIVLDEATMAALSQINIEIPSNISLAVTPSGSGGNSSDTLLNLDEETMRLYEQVASQGLSLSDSIEPVPVNIPTVLYTSFISDVTGDVTTPEQAVVETVTDTIENMPTIETTDSVSVALPTSIDISDPEALGDLQKAIDDVTTASDNLNDSATETQGVVSQFLIDLTPFVSQVTSMTDSLSGFADVFNDLAMTKLPNFDSKVNETKSVLEQFRAKINEVIGKVASLGNILAAKSVQIKTSLVTLGTVGVTNVDRLRKSFEEIDKVLYGVLYNMESIVNTMGVGGYSLVPDVTVSGKRAHGGLVKEGEVYQVNEYGSELLYERGRYYLLPRSDARVIPFSALNQLGRNMNLGNSTNVTNTVVEYGDVTVVIEGGTSLSTDDITRAVRQAQQEQQSSKEAVRNELRRYHK